MHRRPFLRILPPTILAVTTVAAPPATAQSALPERAEVAAIGLCAFAPDQVRPLVDAMAASGRPLLGTKFLSQSFGGFAR